MARGTQGCTLHVQLIHSQQHRKHSVGKASWFITSLPGRYLPRGPYHVTRGLTIRQASLACWRSSHESASATNRSKTGPWLWERRSEWIAVWSQSTCVMGARELQKESRCSSMHAHTTQLKLTYFILWRCYLRARHDQASCITQVVWKSISTLEML